MDSQLEAALSELLATGRRMSPRGGADRAEELARDLERGGGRSSGGVSTNVQALSEEQVAARKAERLPKIQAARDRWKAAAASHQWSFVRLPPECFRLGGP